MKAGTGPAVIPRLKLLPPPLVTIQPSPTTIVDDADLLLFSLVSPCSGEDRVITCNKHGHTLMYNVDLCSYELIPSMEGFTGIRPTVISTGRLGAQEEDLFVLHSDFDVLRMCKDWHWESLPPPPFSGNILSYTVIDGGRTICVSSSPHDFGTCCFDTVEREWWEAGSWVLPFHGGIVCVPDLNIWLGFSQQKPRHLCVTSDLSAMDQLSSLGKPPAVQHGFDDPHISKNWFQWSSNLINLGGGRFCVARVFQEVTIDIDDSENLEMSDIFDSLGSEFVVLTGIELVTSGSPGVKKLEGLRTHKSLRYIFVKDMIQWVL